jgi:nicotinate-nucleotide adenylyltransferase
MTVRRFGIFGGMFDPPHLGHVAAIKAVLELGPRLEEIVVVVGGAPPHRAAPATPARVRHELARRAFGRMSRVSVSDCEIRQAERGLISYMVDTVIELAVDRPGVQPVLIVGADHAASLDRWHRWRDLSRAVEVVVVSRGGSADDEHFELELADPPLRSWHVHMPPVPISSTAIRDMVAEGDLEAARDWVPPALADLLESTYQTPTDA